jgi:hypothetical protein
MNMYMHIYIYIHIPEGIGAIVVWGYVKGVMCYYEYHDDQKYIYMYV